MKRYGRGVCCLFCLLLLPAADPPAVPKGQRIKLTDGQLFVPEGLRINAEGVELTLHLHGGTAVPEKQFTAAGRPGVLVSVAIPGLSSVYTERFKSPRTFQRILDEAGRQLVQLGLIPKPRWRRVVVSSFSAGYGGVREMLKDPAAFARLDALVLADSLYAGYVEKDGRKQVNPEQMAGFVRYARAAAAGEKVFILSHCQLQPDGYASTAETADFLLRAIGGTREKAEEKWTETWRLRDRCRVQGFEVYSFDGDAGPDHMRHLHNLGLLYQRAARSQ